MGSWFTLLSRVGRTTSRTGAGRSSTRRRCSVCRSATTRIRGRRRRGLPEEAREQIRTAYEAAGMAGKARVAASVS